MKRGIIIGFLILLVITLLISSLAPLAMSAEEIKIGAIYPLSGPMALLGDESFRGAEIARIVQNEKGGLWGKQIKFIIGDAPDATAAVAECERLIAVEGMKVIIGTYSSSLAYAASEVAERNGVIYWEMGGIADSITQRGFKYLFRIVTTGSDFGIRAVDVITGLICPALGLEPAKTRVAIIYEDTLYGTTVGSWAAKTALERKLLVVATEAYSAKSVDLSPLILRLKALKPDVVIATSYITDAILFWRQAKELDFNVKALIGTGAGYSMKDFAKAVGEGSDGVLNVDWTQYKTNPQFCPGMTEFVELYKKKYGEPPRSSHSLANYMGTLVLWEVLKRAGSLDPEAIRKAALAVDIPEEATPTGWGVKFAPPEHPMAGTNLRAHPVVIQWFDQEQWTVWPSRAAVRKVILPMPTWEERRKGKR